MLVGVCVRGEPLPCGYLGHVCARWRLPEGPGIATVSYRGAFVPPGTKDLSYAAGLQAKV